MGKNPAYQHYPSDWARDLDDCDLEIEGAWIRICGRLWWAEERGKLTKSLSGWARVFRKTNKKTEKILKFLLEKRIASGECLDKGKITLISRRMVEDERIRKIHKQAGFKGGNPKLGVSYNKPGFVYLIKDNNDLVKIGISANPEKRLYKIKKTNSSVELIDKIWVDNMGKYKEKLHKHYVKYKSFGEWFSIPFNKIPLKGILKANLTPSSSSSSSSSKNNKNTIVELYDCINRKTWDAFIEMRVKKKAPPTDRAIELIQERLICFKEKGLDPNKILEESTINNWCGVFEPKNSKPKTSIDYAVQVENENYKRIQAQKGNNA